MVIAAQKVLVVGAGPTGLSAGLELARLGVDVTVIDKRDEASGFSRAVGILQSTLELLEPSGVANALRKEGVQIRGIRLFDHHKKVFNFDLPWREGDAQSGFVLCLPQDRTEVHLRDAFLRFGGTLKMGCGFEALIRHEDGVTAKLSDGSEQKYDYLLGADGTRSSVRQALGIDFDGFELPEDWSIADAFVEDWPYEEKFSVFRMSGNTMVIAVPMAPGRIRFISNTPDALATLPIEPKISELKRSGTFKISIRQVKEYGKGRVYLAGDAAHTHSPVGGRGMNLGIADACAFAHRLVEGDLAGYSQARHQQGAQVIAATERGRKLIMSGNPLVRGTFIMFVRFLGLFRNLIAALVRRFVLR